MYLCVLKFFYAFKKISLSKYIYILSFRRNIVTFTHFLGEKVTLLLNKCLCYSQCIMLSFKNVLI